MKRLRTLFASTAFATCLAITGPVSADLPVIDISNLKQSILTAAHTLQEVNNQITQIQQFVQMLQNEARNLLSLPFSALQQITSAIDQVNSLMRQAQSLAYNVARIDQQFEQLFPSYGSNVTQAKLISDARARWQASVDTFKHTMEVQSRIVSDIQADEATLSTLVGQSQGASGALQGIQFDQSAAGTSVAPAWQYSGLALRECAGAGDRGNAPRRSRGGGASRVAAVLGQRCELHFGASPGVRGSSAVKSRTIGLSIAAAVPMPTFASAQNVDQLMADRVLLNAELERCKQLGTASVDDARCAGRHDRRKTSDTLAPVRPTRPTCQ